MEQEWENLPMNSSHAFNLSDFPFSLNHLTTPGFNSVYDYIGPHPGNSQESPYFNLPVSQLISNISNDFCRAWLAR